MDTTKEQDILLWKEYKATHSTVVRDKLLKKLAGLINSTVNRWSGPVPRDVLFTEATILAVKALDTYDPTKGVALSTHVVNNLAPISRIVYTYQNTARVPENIALKMNVYNQAVDHLTTLYGRNPTQSELHGFTGFNAKELSKLHTMSGKDLVESSGNISGDFYSDKEDSEEDSIFAIYNSLTPEEQNLFSYITGKYIPHKLNNTEIMNKLGITQAQLSYKKTQLTNKLEKLMHHNGHRS